MTDTSTTLMTAPTDSPAASDGVETAKPEGVAEQTQDQQAPEDKAKTEGDTTPEDKAEGEGSDPKEGEEGGEEATGAPETYEAFTAPEGVEFDEEVLTEFQAIGKELNLPQEQAQKVVDLGVKLTQKWAEQQAENVAALRQEWVDTAKADKEFGGDKLPESLATAKKALDAFGTPELRELLDTYALGDNPEVIRFFVRAGKAISEDTLVAAEGEAKPQPKTAAQVLFPNAN